MRVVYLSHTGNLSGGEIGLCRLIAAADEIESIVILAEDGPLVSALRGAGARVIIAPLAASTRELRRAELGSLDRTSFSHARVVGRHALTLRRHLRSLRPDIVHTNSLKAGVYGTLAARLAGLPSIWHLHDRLTPDYLPASVVGPMRTMVRTLPTALIVPSQSTLDAVGTWFRPGLRTAVIPLPIPIPTHPVEIREQVRVVGMVGRLTPWKGQHIFLDAFAQAFPSGPVRARVIGGALFGEQDYARSLPAQADRLGIGERADFVGFTDNVAGELASMDLLVHCSVLPDPLATTVLEGLAAGLPVISAAAGGTAELLEDGESSLLHQPGDVSSLAAALRRASADYGLRRHISAGGRTVSQRFSSQVVVQQMMALYNDVLA